MDKVMHFEIPYDDKRRCQDFYHDIFGWDIISMDEMDYTMVHTGDTNKKDGMIKEKGVINGGMMQKSDKIKNPVITISVENIDKTSRNINARGGDIVISKFDVGDMGFAAYFKDSEGNVMGLWQNKKV